MRPGRRLMVGEEEKEEEEVVEVVCCGGGHGTVLMVPAKLGDVLSIDL